MSVIDINELLRDVSPDSPCGDNLEYDPAFGELERAARGKEEQTLGDATVAAEPPDWRDVRDRATALLGRTLDLRVAVYLTRALLNTNGLAGFCDGLALLRGLLERYWDCVHPQLDPDDDNDPTFRINTLVTLCDRDATLLGVQEAPLVSSRALGVFDQRHLLIAKGELPAPADASDDVPNQATIDAAFMDADIEELQATEDFITRSSGDLAAIDAILMDKVGSSQAPDLSALSNMLKSMQAEVSGYLARRGVGEATEAEAGDEAQPGATVRPVSGEIASREDAVRMMDKISDYFQRHEPSSPVPLLMGRAKRLVSLSFMEILKDMAPGGLSQASTIGGIEED
jgi:type VI secretion system protein ImpA